MLSLSLLSFAQAQQADDKTGNLLVMGGDCTNAYFLTQFSGLAGGLESKLIIIPSAMEDKLLATDNDLERIKKPFLDFGFKDITILHTRSREMANGDALNDLVLNADAVWITGGRQWRLAKTYLGTRLVNSLQSIYMAGKTIAGTSAGASIMGSLLVRGDSVDHTVMIGDYPKGFGLIKSIAIDQHHLARNRQFDMFEIKRKFPELLGIGIEENTGIVYSKGRFKVIGKGYVSIYDGSRWSAERDTIYHLPPGVEQFYLLEANLEYDTDRQKVIFPEDRQEAPAHGELLQSLEGVYQQLEGLEYGTDIRITVRTEGEQLLFEQSWNGAIYPVHRDHDHTFFRPHANAVFYFEQNKFGSIDRFHYYQHGSTTWEKLD